MTQNLKSGIQSPAHGVMLRLLGVLTIYAALFMSGCQPQHDAPLRIAVLPILDTLPMYVAEVEGYFAEQHVRVEFITAASAAERDQLLQAGQVDGIITDLVALALYNRDKTSVVAVRYAMHPTPGAAQFRVMASAQSGLTRPEDLRGVPIGISEGTVIEYVTVRMLASEGIPTDDITTLAVPRIPERMALLNEGKLSAATLPEPLASLVMQQGAVVVVDDTKYLDVSCSIFAFRKEVIEQRAEAVHGFLAAVEQASDAINGNKAKWNDLLLEKKLLPPTLTQTYTLPDYPNNAIPSEAQFADVVNWLQETGRLTSSPAYNDVVDTSFLDLKQ